MTVRVKLLCGSSGQVSIESLHVPHSAFIIRLKLPQLVSPQPRIRLHNRFIRASLDMQAASVAGQLEGLLSKRVKLEEFSVLARRVA